MAEQRPATLITGASAGLGAEFARQCARRGETLVLAARRKDRLDALAADVGGAEVIAVDLGESGGVATLMTEAGRRGLFVDRLINNAGYGLSGDVATLPIDRQLGMIDLNIRTLTELAHAVLGGMLERGRGAILNVASTAAFQPGPHMAVYFATKAYVLSFSEALHEEVRAKGVTVSALCPGPTRTEFGAVAGFGPGGAFDRLAMDAPAVVAAGLAGLDSGRAVIVPGLMNKLSAQGHRLLPRGALRKIAGRLKL